MKKTIATLLAAAALAGCNDADVASRNLSKAADQFEITRRVVFYNGITGEYMLTVEGLCSLGNYDKSRELSITCKVGDGAYKKHFLGLSDNVTFFVEQIAPSKQSVYHYRVIFKPQAIIPDIDARGSAAELVSGGK
jgi:predicted small secreted protein